MLRRSSSHPRRRQFDFLSLLAFRNTLSSQPLLLGPGVRHLLLDKCFNDLVFMLEQFLWQFHAISHALKAAERAPGKLGADGVLKPLPVVLIMGLRASLAQGGPGQLVDEMQPLTLGGAIQTPHCMHVARHPNKQGRTPALDQRHFTPQL